MEAKSIFKFFSVCVFTLMIQLTIMLYPSSQESDTAFEDEKSKNELVANISE